jgi:hypothetical protein
MRAQGEVPDWEPRLIDEAIDEAESRLEAERDRAKKRALQLAREQGYHRLAVAIDRPARPTAGEGQLTLFPTDRTLFDDIS